MKIFPVILTCFSVVFYSCSNNDKYEISSGDYEHAKEDIGKTEMKNPARFIAVNGSNKKNLLGQTVVKGTLQNNARIISYKDIDVKLSFYSKTGALLEEDHEVVFENLQPGRSVHFKTKYFTPKGTDSVGMQVITARF